METKVKTEVTGLGKGLKRAAAATAMTTALALTMAGITVSATTLTEETENKQCAEEGCGGTYDNGFCNIAGEHYEEAKDTDGDGCYEISNGGQLYWFAEFVNEQKGTDYPNDSAGAVLTANIKVNENVLVNGELNSDDTGKAFRSWVPMCPEYNGAFTGTFDGNNHTISGLYYDDITSEEIGLFARVNSGGVVKNLGLEDSYFRAQSYVGGIVARNAGGIIENCIMQGIFLLNRKRVKWVFHVVEL